MEAKWKVLLADASEEYRNFLQSVLAQTEQFLRQQGRA